MTTSMNLLHESELFMCMSALDMVSEFRFINPYLLLSVSLS